MATTSARQLGKTHLALLSAAAQRQDGVIVRPNPTEPFVGGDF